MKFYHVKSGPLSVNSYFLVNEETNGAIVIDSGENYNLMKDIQKKCGFIIKAVILTHAHFDHAGNVKKLQDDGAKIFVSKSDADKLYTDGNLGKKFGRKFEYLTADYTFCDGEEITVEGITLKVILTPGHTEGSATFMLNDMLFTGDTLFYECVGRTDFLGGNRVELEKSVNKLLSLSGDYKVYPGHGEFTTLSHEREFNGLKEYD